MERIGRVRRCVLDNMTWVEFEQYPLPPRNTTRELTLKPKSFPEIIDFPVAQDYLIREGGANNAQAPVSSSIAAIGHELQGLSKGMLIASDWNCRHAR